MKITIELDDKLLRMAKQHAIATRRTLTQTIQDSLVLLLIKERGLYPAHTVELLTFGGDSTYLNIDIDSNASFRDRMELPE